VTAVSAWELTALPSRVYGGAPALIKFGAF